MSDICIRDYLNNYDNGMYDSADRSVQCDAGWYDWFCKDSSLKSKTVTLTRKLRQLILSPKVDIYKNYVFFKNNCGYTLYDDFRICDLDTGDVLYTVCPKDSALKSKTVTLTRKLRQLILSPKVDIYKNYVFFKNNCGYTLYDDFRICDLDTGDVLYTVTPKDSSGNATVWGKDNNFDAPLVTGHWVDVKDFFGV